MGVWLNHRGATCVAVTEGQAWRSEDGDADRSLPTLWLCRFLARTSETSSGILLWILTTLSALNYF